MYNKLMHFAEKLNLVYLIGVLILIIAICSLSASSAPAETKVILSVLLVAIYLWITELVAFPVSGLIIISLISLFLGLLPDPSGQTIGTSKALALALKGFSSTSMAMIMGSLIIAAAMKVTGLDQLLAINIMSKMKNSVNSVLMGCLLVGICFAFLIPSPTGRTSVLIPILLGITKIIDNHPQKKLTMIILLGAVHISTIWNIGVMTATTHNIAGLELISSHYNFHVNWIQWFIYTAPYAALLTIFLFIILKIELKRYTLTLDNNQQKFDNVKTWNKLQKKLLSYLMFLLFLWITEGYLHKLSVSSSMTLIASLLLIPKIGVFSNWKEAEKLLPWGVLLMFGASLSLGMLLVEKGATSWLTEKCFSFIPVNLIPVAILVVITTIFTIILHLGFASASGLTFSIIPVYLAFTDQFIQHIGYEFAPQFVLIQLFAVSLGFILPTNAPQNMLGYATGFIDIKTFIRIGIKLTIASVLLFLLFSYTWWQWLGLIKH